MILEAMADAPQRARLNHAQVRHRLVERMPCSQPQPDHRLIQSQMKPHARFVVRAIAPDRRPFRDQARQLRFRQTDHFVLHRVILIAFRKHLRPADCHRNQDRSAVDQLRLGVVPQNGIDRGNPLRFNDATHEKLLDV